MMLGFEIKLRLLADITQRFVVLLTAGEQILKLRTLGLTEEEAEQKIINGFLR